MASVIASGERHVLMIITGGTICMQESPNGLVPTPDFVRNCLEPNPDFNDGSLLKQASIINESAEHAEVITLRGQSSFDGMSEYTYSVLEFAKLIDSSSMDSSHWNQIIKCLAANWKNFDAFVILHGTDTLAYTASDLSFMLRDIDKTVIVTGSQLSMYVPHSDAHDNLLDSLTVAATFIVPEVGVVLHHHLYRGTRVTKVSAFNLAAFTTPNAKPLASFPNNHGKPWSASIHSDTIEPVSAKNGEQSAPSNQPQNCDADDLKPVMNLDTTKVAVLKVYPGMGAGLITSIIASGIGGLVLETFGAGNIPLAQGSKNILQILTAAVKMGIVVVSVTQCLTGSVTSAYESARLMETNGIITGLDMTTEAAYTKLAYLLSLPDLTQEQIAHKMKQNLRGELTADMKEEPRIRDGAHYGSV